jgi:3-hydroxybutyryl-CoA dehydrogenase
MSADRIGILGGGIMGTGIAEVCVRAGLDVRLVEVDAAAAKRAGERVEASLGRAVSRGKIEAADATAATARLECVDDFEALADRTVVIEAVVEAREAKLDIFARLPAVVADEGAILASNTSSIPIVELAAAAGKRGDRVLGLHFFNPVPVLALVEIIPSLLTDRAVADRRPRPGRIYGERPPHPVPSLGDTHVRTGSGHRRGRRQGNGRGLRPSNGPAGPG